MSMSNDTPLGFCNSHSDTEPTTIPLGKFVEMIREPDLATIQNVAAAKAAYTSAGGGKTGKEAAKSFKAQLPCVMVSATGTRTAPDLATGLLNVDLDELGPRLEEIREKLRADPHVAVGPFTSPSGDGLKAAMRVPVIPKGADEEMRAHHHRNFSAVQNYCAQVIGITPDGSTCDLMRLCYLSHDPGCALNLEADELDIEKWIPQGAERPGQQAGGPKKVAGGQQDIVPAHIVEAMLMSIPARPQYKDWVAISAAVRNSLGDKAEAIKLLRKWSPEEQEGEYETLLGASFDQIGFGTLQWHAGEHGYGGVVRRFFYAGKGGFAMRGEKDFIPLTSESAVKQHLRQYRVPSKRLDGLLCRIREEQHVKHIGNIAGHTPGLHEFNGDKFLVTRGPKIITGKEGRSDFLLPFFLNLLGDDIRLEQLPAFFCWLAHCRRAVIEGRRRQTPALALTGSIGDGKSLAIEIIKRSLGGRAEKAYRFFSGDDQFNSELAGAELLVSDDDAVSRDHRSRLQLAQAIKSNLFSDSMRVRGMHSDAFSCAPVHAVVIAANSDPEHLRVLPELDENMRDKIMLMKTKPASLPEGIAGRNDLISMRIDADLPGFLHFIDHVNMEEAYDHRGRLRCFWHPEILEAIGLLSPETRLLELVHQAEAVRNAIAQAGKWVGTATALEGLLVNLDSPVHHLASRLLPWPRACGTYLGKLADTQGTGVSRGPKDAAKIQTYIIENPTPAAE